MALFRFLLFPFSLLYGSILWTRNQLYAKGILGSTSFDIPTISIGNLAFGGTGKTPHIEWLIRLLQLEYKVAVLSRGYKRKTQGYVYGDQFATAFTIGDEPMQIHRKFPEVSVGVCESRVLGIPNLLFDAPATQVVLLDDAYQHRAIKPGFNILLTDYRKLFTRDYLAPLGTLREYSSASKRADVIIVTKCPPTLDTFAKAEIVQELEPEAHQQVYFSYLAYGQIIPFHFPLPEHINEVLFFAGIANTEVVVKHLQTIAPKVKVKAFPDHHAYSVSDLEKLLEDFQHMKDGHAMLVTTEKDQVKLEEPTIRALIEDIPLGILPVHVEFFEPDRTAITQQLLEYVNSHTGSH